mgnify:CR=1 FL=1
MKFDRKLVQIDWGENIYRYTKNLEAQMKYEQAMYHKLLAHSKCTIIGREYSSQSSAIEIANYADGSNLAIECVKCNEVIFDVDRPIYGGE